MKTALKMILVIFLLSVSVSAADRTQGAVFYNTTVGTYNVYGPNRVLNLHVVAFNAPDRDNGGLLSITYFDNPQQKVLYITDLVIPTASLKITGNNLAVEIADLRDLANSEYDIYESGFDGPIPLHCTFTQTDLWEAVEKGTIIHHTPQPDGSVLMTKENTNVTNYSATVEGNIGSDSLPLVIDPITEYGDAFGAQGDLKSRM